MSECNCCCCQRVKHDSSLPLYHHIEIPKPPAAATTSISTIDLQSSTNADVPSESNTTEKKDNADKDVKDKSVSVCRQVFIGFLFLIGCLSMMTVSFLPIIISVAKE